MIVNTSFTKKSGNMGSSMFSRSGRATIHYHIPFCADQKKGLFLKHSLNDDIIEHQEDDVLWKMTQKRKIKFFQDRHENNLNIDVNRHKISHPVLKKVETPSVGRYNPNYASVEKHRSGLVLNFYEFNSGCQFNL